MSATTKAILVLARGLAVITQKGSKQIDHKEVGAGGKQQRKGREDENALTAHWVIISQHTSDSETDISPTATAFTEQRKQNWKGEPPALLQEASIVKQFYEVRGEVQK